METGRKLMDAMRPEAARRLEADLAGKEFVSDLEWRRRPGGTGGMTWRELPGRVKVEPDELSRVQSGELTSFMRGRDFHGRSRLRAVRRMPGLARFWLDGSPVRATGMPCAAAWTKKVNFPAPRRRGPKAADADAAAARCGAAERQALDGKDTVASGRKSEDEGKRARATCLRLMKAVKPEAVRRLEADLSGKRFVSDLEPGRRLAL